MATLEELRRKRRDLVKQLGGSRLSEDETLAAPPDIQVAPVPVAPVATSAVETTPVSDPAAAPAGDPFASLRQPEPSVRPSIEELRERRRALEPRLTDEQRETFERLLRGGEELDVETSAIPLPESFLKMRDKVDVTEGLRREREDFRPDSVFPELEGGDSATTLLERASAAGILTDEPAPFRAIAASSFGLTEKDQLSAIQQGIEFYTGQDTELRIGPRTNELEYLRTNPQTGEKRFALVNELGVGLSDIAAGAGPIGVVGAFEAAGATLAIFGIKLRDPKKIESVGAVSAGIGEMVRLMIGKQLGLNQELDTVDDFLSEGLFIAGISKASSRVLNIGLKVGKLIKNVLEGKPIPPGVAKRIREKFAVDARGQQEADEVQGQINAVLKAGGEEPVFELNLAQKTGDPELLDIQASLKNDPFVGPRLKQRRREVQSGAEKFFNITSKEFDEPLENAPNAVDLGQDIRQLIIEGMSSERRVAKKLVTQAKLEERRAIRALDPTVKEADITPSGITPNIVDAEVGTPYRSKYVGNPLREVLETEYEALAYGFTNAFEGLKTVSGVTDIPLTNTRKAVGKLNMQVRNALFKFTTAGREQLVRGFDMDAASSTPEAVADQLKFLNDKLRQGKTDPTIDRQALLEVRNALDLDSAQAYGKTTADLEMWQALKQEYGKFKDLYNRTAIDDILKRSEGRGFDMANEKVFKEFFKPDNDTFAASLRTALDGNPAAQGLVRRGILSEYKEAVVKDGHIDTKEHKKWIKKFEGTIKPFFSPKELAEIKSKPGQIGKVLQRKTEESQALLDQINSKLETRFEKMSPGDIFKTIWHGDNFTGDNLRLVLPTIKKDPELFKGLQNLAHQHLRQSVTSRRNGFDFVDSSKLDVYLGEFGFRNRVKELFGPEYLSNLDTLNKGLLIAQREGEFIPEPIGNAAMDILRAQVGLFTRTGRFLTAAVRTRSKAANEMMIRALLSKGDALKLAEGASIKPGTERALAWATSLGAPEFYLISETGNPTQTDIQELNDTPIGRP